ncbi:MULTISPECIES: BamA/TamA family outer membrane protein [unclassified Fibrobacter]|uniref:BamA/TamA family outer membrane protein n=1 Tax=unclassified Fibrobacter TaxID=2634177 RepID=UPI000D6C4864|nr:MULTISPECIES: BamA/TamA family outer membrane protein [unclassified Fibrobacter]PWJ70104.1 surface antigen-like protein [Fibrobacter sp. UWR4]PZW73452.1 surface antigen-like protein [Fibrobacter sp. UWR1]
MRSFSKSLLVAAAVASQSFGTEDFQRFTALPVLGYSEETELQYGAMAIVFLKPDEQNGKVPEIDFMASGSTRGQYQFQLTPYFYLHHDQVSGWLDFRYQNWVASYFGMGNNPDIDEYINFDRERFYFGAEIDSKVGVPKQFKYGAELHIEHSHIKFDSPDENKGGKSTDKVTPPADAHSGWRNGAGYLLAFDTRDNTNWTRHGFLAQWQQMFYSDHLGDYSFDMETLDLRGYTYLFWGTSMAVGALWQRSGGDVPFDMLAGPDGTKRFRGVESLYFRDRQAMILQAELRKYLGWRLAGDIFFEGGKTGDHFSELMRNKWHRSVGFGGMLILNKKEQLYARGEFSWVDFDHLGMTVYIRQAF